MTARKLLLLAILILLPVLKVSAQGEPQSVDEQQLLLNSSNVTFELARRKLELNEESSTLARPLKPTDKIYFRQLMTNTSALPIEIILTNPYSQHRPVLFRNGEEVPYRKDIVETVQRADVQTDFPHRRMTRLEPSVATEIELLVLSDWYDRLQPGNYELTDRFRFVVGGSWIESNKVTFEVAP